MTPDERQLISGLFDRLRSQGATDKDREAERFIADAMRQTPDSAYLLVQSVLANEHFLQQASDRIEDLEARLRDAEDELQQRQGGEQKSSGGSFLGGIFGGSKPQSAPPARAATSVPSAGSPRYGEPGSPWGQQAAPRGGSPGGGYAQPQPGGYAPPPQAGAPAGGGFFRSALQTAAGVAGGMMAANALQNIFGGHSAHAAGQSSPLGGPSPYEVNSAQGELRRLDAEQDADQDQQIADQDQDAAQDADEASYDDDNSSSGWGSSDDNDI
ncbi:MAG: DUF2076 domain-containing protein [Proteobacteria bacterium]|nr:DUF2076 domain-containing protein [Pseudomonadota bacterium]